MVNRYTHVIGVRQVRSGALPRRTEELADPTVGACTPFAASGLHLSSRDMLTRVDLTLDCANPEVLAVFWRTAAGYVNEPPPPPFRTRDEWLAQFADEDDDVMGAAWLRDPTGVAPRLCLLQVPEPKTAKNRLHLDLRVSGSGTPEEKWSRVTVEVARLTAAGGAVVCTFTGHHVVMTDPEGNEFCVA